MKSSNRNANLENFKNNFKSALEELKEKLRTYNSDIDKYWHTIEYRLYSAYFTGGFSGMLIEIEEIERAVYT